MKRRAVLFFLIPTFTLLLVFSYYPFLAAFSYSFCQWDGMSPSKNFVGFRNFVEVFQNHDFLDSAVNIAILLLAGIIKTLTVPILVAELLFAVRGSRWAYAYRVLFVLPMVVPMIVFLLIWQKFYQADFGLINQLIRLLNLGPYLEVMGLDPSRQAWLGKSETALGSLIFMGFPWVSPVAVLIILAGLLNIPQSLLDAAKVDGAGFRRRFLLVDFPLILGQVKLLIVLTILGTIQEFQVQYIMTMGGPGTATMTPGLHMFLYAFNYGRLGYASAVAVVLFLVMLTLTVLNLRYIRSEVEYEAT
jgi:raffinose/stachyose/melibiose transport system permease protein